MARLIVMDHTGDSRHEFDPAKSAEVTAAMARFDELVGEGYTAARRTAGGQSELIRAFDPTIEETLFIPRLMGG